MRLVICARACNAIHCASLANSRRGTDAGFWAGQSSGCVLVDRERHSRLQNCALQLAAAPEAAQPTTRGEPGTNGVVQNEQVAFSVVRRAYISLRFSTENTLDG